ncbi:MAG: PTS sugar transporter subunit IIA [Candidatus Kapabacteria bacterium]|nr:PTS sugar transporter subunit IIA [Candidatus Kapabacteria bacterium]
MNITDLLKVESIVVGLTASSKDDLFEKMLRLAEKSGKIIDFSKAQADLIERENLMTTGIGNGIALPHAKTSGVIRNTAAFAVLKEPLSYMSMDGKDVNLVFLFLGNDSGVGIHLRILSKISRILSNPYSSMKLLSAKTSEQALNYFMEFEKII